jgi:hypothetical protein
MNPQSFGLKISLPGYSVETATPEQCSVHSSYDTLKVGFQAPSPLEANILVTFQDNPVAGTYPIYTINHEYNYIPACYFFFDVRSSSNNLGVETGTFFPLDELEVNYFQAIVQPQTIIFQLVIGETGLDTLTGEYFAFRYYVFAENGI